MSLDAVWGGSEVPERATELERSFDGFLALEWLALTDRSAAVTFEVREVLKQPFGLLHGGIYSAVAESVASLATIRVVWQEGMVASGLSNYASFLRPVTAGTVHVAATLRSRSEREWLWGHEFRDDAGRLCSLVDVTIAVRPRMPAQA